MGKLYDVVATVGTYKDKGGEDKRRYKNVGVVIEGQDGKKYLKLEALAFNDDGNLVNFFGLFEPRKEDGKPRKPAASERTEDVFKDDVTL